MNTELKHTTIFESAALIVPVPTFKHKNADSINLGLAFFMQHRESLRILPTLILSSVNQRLTIYPNDFINSQSCSEPLSSTVNCILIGELIIGAFQVAI